LNQLEVHKCNEISDNFLRLHCAMLYIGKTGRFLRTRFGEHWHAVIGSEANQPVARHFNSSNHSVSDIKIRAVISGSNDSRKKKHVPHGIVHH
jgi:hypothetical protein